MAQEIDEMNDYIGDGVYVSFDGYQIWLAVNHHTNKVVALEPEVMEKLINYAERIKAIKFLEKTKNTLKPDSDEKG